ncbi:MAG: LysR family transcriptional regulator [Cyanobacteria bacterium P01_C01_bin.89]
MTKIDDMALFVQVIKAEGLAAAGRQLGLSPASMTARIKKLEARYDTRLINRSTRSISLTDAGHRFYEACLQVVADVEAAESVLLVSKQEYSGPLKVTAPSDFGRQFVAPAIAQFVDQYPQIQPYLHLGDRTVNLIEEGFDLGIRYGNLPDSSLMMRSLDANNQRVLCASPNYLKQHGMPQQPEDLEHHNCLVMERFGEKLNQWKFQSASGQVTIRINPALMGNDGALIRQWAVWGKGIALKSIWDIKQDLAAGRLVKVLDDYVVGAYAGDEEKVGLQMIYPSRQYLPRQVAGFIDFFTSYLSEANG